MLRPLNGIFPPQDYKALLVGLNEPDDAAVYQLDERRALISTVDFFPPVVDDPYAFGAIAATNALSDVYAMGGTPLLAINLAAFPDGLDMGILTEILRGGAEKVREAGAVIAGGHTVMDKEPKYGLAVTGEVHPSHLIRKGGARPGDALILTKSVGTGVITTAHKRNQVQSAHLDAVVQGMSHLNKTAAALAQKYQVHAMTDITGYSLMGHGHEMAHLSSADFVIQFSELRWYPGAVEYAETDFIPGGLYRNQEYFSQWVRLEGDFVEWQKLLLYDPQTSGGLLMAAAADKADMLLQDLRTAGETAAVIGTVVAGHGNLIIQNR